MDLQRLIETGVNVTLAVTLFDLNEWHKEIIQDTKKELENVVLMDKAETYPSPKQVCEILNVDASTLWRWNKRGYLTPAEVGGKRRYKMSDIKRILNGGSKPR